jgi:flagellar protein FlaG
MLIQNIGNMGQDMRAGNSAHAPVPVDTAQHTETLPQPAAQATPAVKATGKLTSSELQNMVDGINRTMKQMNNTLQFSVDQESQRTVIKVLDSETGDVIRQFPSDEALAISQSIEQLRQGILLKQKA